MEPGSPDTIDQVPATGNPMKPASGTYGDVANLDRLKSELALPGQSAGGPPTQGAPAPPPGAPTGRTVPSAPGGLPEALLAPSGAPQTPMSTPLRGSGAPNPTATSQQKRLRILEALTTDSSVSVETREWAEAVLREIQSKK